VRDALETCVGALNRLVTYKLKPSLQRRLDDLGARKEFLDTAEHDELLALVDFTQHRTIEALEAQLALSRLRNAFPNMVTTS
jgi:prephenate dehydrogenase